MIDALYFRGAGSSVPVQVDVVAGELRFAAGEETRALPLADADLALGGDQRRYLVCTFRRGADDEEVVYLLRDGLIPALEAGATPTAVMAQARALVAAHRKRWVKTRTLFLSAGAAALTLAVALLLSARTLLVATVPTSWEEAAGRSFYEELEPTLDTDVHPDLQQFVERLGRRLLATRPEQPYTFTFHVVRDPAVNAFAFPGGTVVVHTGLIAKAGSPEEVAGVIGHELSHVLQRHSLRRAVDHLGLMAVLSVLVGGGVEAAAELHTAASVVGLKFSRDQEAEADAAGARLLHDAGIDPRAMASFFDELAAEEGALRDSLEFLSSHPVSADRSLWLRELIQALPPRDYQPIDVEWERLQRLAASGE